MFHGGLNTLMQMLGMARIAQNEEFHDLCVAQLPPGDLRQVIGDALTYLRRTLHSHQPVTHSEILSLTQANQALEARVMELERQLTAVLAPRP